MTISGYRKYVLLLLFLLLTKFGDNFFQPRGLGLGRGGSGIEIVLGLAVWDPEAKAYVNFDSHENIPPTWDPDLKQYVGYKPHRPNNSITYKQQQQGKMQVLLNEHQNLQPRHHQHQPQQPQPQQQNYIHQLQLQLHYQQLHALLPPNCKMKNKSYISMEEAKKRTPPLLISYPGSGNTMMRVLIESLTGFITGSLEIRDQEFFNSSVFLGEKFCGIRQVAIKAHPQDFFHYHTKDTQTKQMRWMNREQRRKCHKGSVFSFNRFIVIYRNPADAIWANYQLSMTYSHSGKILQSEFNATAWNEYVVEISTNWLTHWTSFFNSTLYETPKEDLFLVKYEEIIESSKRFEIAKSLMEFMKYPDVTDDEIKCTYIIADNSTTTRRRANFNSSFVSASYAFYKGLTKETVCIAKRNLAGYLAFGGYPEFAPILKHREGAASVDPTAGEGFENC